MGGFGSKQDQQDLEKEIEKKLEKEFDKINIPKEQKKKFFKIAKKEAMKMGKEELKKNKEELKKDPVVWCPKDDKSGCTVFQRSEKPHGCFGDFNKEQCERSRLKKVRKQNLPTVNTLYSQRKNLRKGSLKLNEPMVWCPNNKKTSCVSSPISKKPHGCFGDFNKEQCERSRLKKVRKQNLPVVNTLVTQRNVGFRREAPKAWCPKTENGKSFCEYRTLDSNCKPPSFSEQQCLNKFPCQLIKSYKGSDKEKLKNICRVMGNGSNGKMTCLQDNAQRNAEEDDAHCVWEGEVCLHNKSLVDTATKNGFNESRYNELCKAHSIDNNCGSNYGKNLTNIFKNNETDLCKTFYN